MAAISLSRKQDLTFLQSMKSLGVPTDCKCKNAIIISLLAASIVEIQHQGSNSTYP